MLLRWRMCCTLARRMAAGPFRRGWLAQLILRGDTVLVSLRYTDRGLTRVGGDRFRRRTGDGVRDPGIYIFLENCFERHCQYLKARLIDTSIQLQLDHVRRPNFPRSVQSLGTEQSLVMTNNKNIIFKNSL